ncbi:MAG: hypothetical protein LBP26_01710 [Clostridiales bacterium]|jgi:bifunctional N-acetylglucosamine-1-phosphate-uridyltransferase/glucosamine-1-phosphate-acetyltransferase GlmU-like protein|nr:hypothetical protein [Clostridiales bacterium]
MDEKFFGIIFRVAAPTMGETADIEILGKSMLSWVALSFGESPYAVAPYNDREPLPDQARAYLNPDYPVTVILFSDTPLITKKTVFAAVAELKSTGKNVLRLTRGFVCSTQFLMNAEKIYSAETRYFDAEDFVTAFSFKQVALISDILRNRILEYHMERGVHIEDMASAFIGCDAVIGKGVVIGPNNIIRGKTYIKDGAKILSGNMIDTCIIESGAVINSSQMTRSFIGRNTSVGPFAYIRPESVIGPDCRIGDFVEIKKSVLGRGCKVSHLTYIGDAELGEACNVGCGVVFANYDGRDKHKAKVGNRVFIGSNSNIIAPVTLADGAFIAAGSTITESVDKNALAIARARQVVKTDWDNNKFRDGGGGE